MESDLTKLLSRYNITPLKPCNGIPLKKASFPNYSLDLSIKKAITEQEAGKVVYYLIPNGLDSSYYDLIMSNKKNTLCFSMIDFDINIFDYNFNFMLSLASGGFITSPFTHFSGSLETPTIISDLKSYNKNILQYKHNKKENNYDFKSIGKNKLLKIYIENEKVKINVGNCIFSKIILDKKFNLEGVEISKHNAKKLNITNKLIKANSYDSIIKKIEEYLDLLDLKTDKTLKIIEEADFNEIIEYSKSFLDKKEFLNSEKMINTFEQIIPKLNKLSKLIDIETIDFSNKLDAIEKFLKYEEENGHTITKPGFINNINNLKKYSIELKNFNVMEK